MKPGKCFLGIAAVILITGGLIPPTGPRAAHVVRAERAEARKASAASPSVPVPMVAGQINLQIPSVEQILQALMVAWKANPDGFNLAAANEQARAIHGLGHDGMMTDDSGTIRHFSVPDATGRPLTSQEDPVAVTGGQPLVAVVKGHQAGIWLGRSPVDTVDRTHAFRHPGRHDLAAVVAVEQHAAMEPAAARVDRRFEAGAAVTALLLIIALFMVRAMLVAAKRVSELAKVQASLAVVTAERDVAQATARTQADMLAATLDGLQDGLAIIDANMCLQVWNDHFAEVASFPPDILRVGLPIADILHAQAVGGQFGKIDSPEAEVARRMGRLRSGPHGVVQRQRPDGHTIELRRKGLPDGGFVTIYSDITEQKRMEADLRDARLSAEAATAAKGAIVASVLRQAEPSLEALSKHLAAIQEELPTRQWLPDLASIRQHGTSFRQLIDELAELERINSGKVLLKPRLFDIRQLVESIMPAMRLSGKANTSGLVVTVAEGVPSMLQADPERLRQVLMISLVTAMRDSANAMRDGAASKVRIQLDAKRDPSPMVLIQIGPSWAIADRAALAVISRPTTPPDPPSLAGPAKQGLGLVICQDLMTLMNGCFACEPCVSSGGLSAFSIHIALPFKEIGALPSGSRPVAEADADRFGNTVPTSDNGPNHAWRRPLPRTRVLLVEDVVPSQIVGATLLRREGHFVDIAESGEAAVEAVSRQPYDIVFMDILMPGINGVEATRAIRALPGPAASIPIIALTADVSREDEAVFKPAGMNGSLGKPIALPRLIEAMAVHVWSRRPGDSDFRAIDTPPITALPDSTPPVPFPASSGIVGTGGATGPVLSTARIMELRGSLPPEIFVSLIEECLNDLDHRLPALQRAFAAGSVAAITAHSHAMLGVAGGYGMAALESRLRGVAAAARTGDTSSLGPDTMRQVEADFAEAVRALREMMQDVLA